MLKNVKLEKEKIKVDFKLQEKFEALRLANMTIQRLDSEVIQSRQSTEKIVRQFERQTVEGRKINGKNKIYTVLISFRDCLKP